MTTPSCIMCPPVDGKRPMATVRAVVRFYLYPGGRKMLHHSEPTDLCDACFMVIKAAGDLSPHAAVQHHPIEEMAT